MVKKDIKNLTINELKRQDKALDKQREFTVTIADQKYKMSHDVVFRTSKKNELLDDMIDFFQEAVNDNDILEYATPYTTLLILKHFTSLEISDDITEAIATLKVLGDLGILAPIIAELPEDQLTSVYELITNTIKNMENNLAEAENEAKKLAEQVENPVVLEEMIPDGTD